MNEHNPINIGIIVQSDDEIVCKFMDKPVSQDNKAEELIFKNLENTFNQKFQEITLSVTDKITRQRKKIKYTSEEYLDYLNSNFLNNYIFENEGKIQEENINSALNRLYRTFVDSSID